MPSKYSKSFLKTSIKSMSSSKKGDSDGTYIIVSIVLLLFAIIAGTIIYNSYNKEKFTVDNILYYLYMENCGHCKDFTPVWDAMNTTNDANTSSKFLMKKLELNNDEVGKKISTENKIDYAPAIILVTPKKSYIYEGVRTQEAIFRWISDKL